MAQCAQLLRAAKARSGCQSCCIFIYETICNKTCCPGSELVLGPWTHGGLTDQDVRLKTSFNQPQHSLDFINKCCAHNQPVAQHLPSRTDSPSQRPAGPQPTWHNSSAALWQTNNSPASQADAKVALTHHQRSVSGSQSEAGTQLLSQTMTSSQQQTMPNDAIQTHSSSNGQLHAHSYTGSSPQTSKHSTSSSSADFCPVHYFLMGQMTHRKWRHSSSWPPSDMQPIRLYLTAGTRTGPSPSPTVGHGGSHYFQVQHNGSASEDGEISSGPSRGAGRVNNSPGTGAGPVSNRLSREQDGKSPALSSSGMQQPSTDQNGACEQDLARQLPTEVVQVGHSYRQAMQMGELSREKQSHWIRFRHEVHLQQPLKVQPSPLS